MDVVSCGCDVVEAKGERDDVVVDVVLFDALDFRGNNEDAGIKRHSMWLLSRIYRTMEDSIRREAWWGVRSCRK